MLAGASCRERDSLISFECWVWITIAGAPSYLVSQLFSAFFERTPFTILYLICKRINIVNAFSSFFLANENHPGTVVSAMIIMMPWLCVFDDLGVTCFLELQETVPLAVDSDPWVASSSFSSVKDRKRMIMMMMMIRWWLKFRNKNVALSATNVKLASGWWRNSNLNLCSRMF